jgi:DNA-binding NarL/FixJ family response regulator
MPHDEAPVEPISVLIVDDNLAVRDGLRSILRPHVDIEVVGEAADGLEAIAEADQRHPCVILMDGQMPQMDGLEATRRIKERLPQTSIILLSAHAEFIEAALTAGADGYLMKDCGRHVLLEEIRKFGGRG